MVASRLATKITQGASKPTPIELRLRHELHVLCFAGLEITRAATDLRMQESQQVSHRHLRDLTLQDPQSGLNIPHTRRM